MLFVCFRESEPPCKPTELITSCFRKQEVFRKGFIICRRAIMNQVAYRACNTGTYKTVFYATSAGCDKTHSNLCSCAKRPWRHSYNCTVWRWGKCYNAYAILLTAMSFSAKVRIKIFAWVFKVNFTTEFSPKVAVSRSFCSSLWYETKSPARVVPINSILVSTPAVTEIDQCQCNMRQTSLRYSHSFTAEQHENKKNTKPTTFIFMRCGRIA